MSEVFEQVMALCARGSFTGLLRVQTRDGNGEVRFLSGIQDGVRFDSLSGDAALARLKTASEPEFEVIAALPPIDASSTTPVPIEGGLDRIHAATLMRYCESNSLTCALELEAGGQLLTARYRLGELLSVEPDSELTAQIAEAKQGAYRFKLPRFELPAGARSKNGGAPVSTGTPAAAPVAARPAAPNVGAAFKPAAAPAVQPVRVAAPHQRPTPAATPAAVAAVRAVPAAASASPARSPAPAASSAAAPTAARSAASPGAAAQARPAAAAAQARPAAAAASPARPAVNAEPVRPAPIAEVRAAPAEPARPAAAAPAPSPSPVAPAAAPAAAKPAAPSPAPEPIAARSPAPAAAPAAVKSPVAKPAEGRPARPTPREEMEVEERSGSRAGLWIVMALVVVGLVVWFVMGAPLPK
jgi:hypothetical protein